MTLMGTTMMHHYSTYNNSMQYSQGGFSIYVAVTYACVWQSSVCLTHLLHCQLHCLDKTTAPVD